MPPDRCCYLNTLSPPPNHPPIHPSLSVRASSSLWDVRIFEEAIDCVISNRMIAMTRSSICDSITDYVEVHYDDVEEKCTSIHAVPVQRSPESEAILSVYVVGSCID